MTIAHPAEKLRTVPLMGDTAASRAISLWLWFVAGLILAMVIVGGATRLTESGLSITEWQPLLGAIPPMNESDWLAAFEKYKQIPQYSHLNEGMSLAAFKTIYWWEWGHRFLGPLHRHRICAAAAVLLADGPSQAANWCQVPRHSGAGRRAGRHRLVHGEVGPQRSRRRQPVSLGAAFNDRIDDSRDRRLAGA